MDKLLFRRAELRGVNHAAMVISLNRIPRVQHLVKNDEFNQQTGDRRLIQRFADGDGLMGRIMMAENRPGVALAPADLPHSQFVLKVVAVELIEDLLQIEAAPLGGPYQFKSPRAARFVDALPHWRRH